MVISKYDSDSKEIVVEKLRERGVLILPTDTVYGFSGLVPWTDDIIRQIKGRSETKPFIQLISNPDELASFTNDKINDELLKYWPGPLTIIVSLKEDPSKTIAFRCPGDEWLRDIIKMAGFPIYSTSVNRSGFPVMSHISDIIKEFERETSLIVDDGDKINSKASTIVTIKNEKVEIIRQGELKINL